MVRGPRLRRGAPPRGAGSSRPLVARAAPGRGAFPPARRTRRERRSPRRLQARVKGQNVLVCGDFLVCWCGKVGVGGGCFIASLYVVPGWARRCTACGCLFYRESVRGSLICLGGAWAGRLRRRYSPCHAAARRWLRYRRCYRRCYGWQRMTPARRAFHECRMQFPRHRVSPRNRIVGITTFADTVESSPN